MFYRYSPDSYPVSFDMYRNLKTNGDLLGAFLEEKYGKDKIIEYRIDYVVDKNSNLWATEVQTDDRGLPAVAIARNAKGKEKSGLLPGVCEALASAFKKISNKENPSILMLYPKEESFYYSGMSDMGYIFQALDIECIPAPKEAVQKINDDTYKIFFGKNGLSVITTPDFVWNFAQNDNGQNSIQPIVDKSTLLEIWQDANYFKLRKFIPETIPANDAGVLKNKSDWVLKPISGRWSEGVLFGPSTPQSEWESAILSQKNLIAQRFVEPRRERFFVERKKKASFDLETLIARVEGYYVREPDSGWVLADILATCTKDLPVHGKRDCIMIPGTIDVV
jgi:hypothetical protein